MKSGSRLDLTKLELSGIDIAALIVTELPFSANPQQFAFLSMLTFLENSALILVTTYYFEWYFFMLVFSAVQLVSMVSKLILIHSYIHGHGYFKITTGFVMDFVMVYRAYPFVAGRLVMFYNECRTKWVHFKIEWQFSRQIAKERSGSSGSTSRARSSVCSPYVHHARRSGSSSSGFFDRSLNSGDLETGRSAQPHHTLEIESGGTGIGTHTHDEDAVLVANTLTNGSVIRASACASASASASASTSANPTPCSDDPSEFTAGAGAPASERQLAHSAPSMTKSKPIGYCSFRSLKGRDLPAFFLFLLFWALLGCYGWGKINKQYCDGTLGDSTQSIDPNADIAIFGDEHDAKFCYWKRTAEQYSLYVALFVYVISIVEAMTCPLSRSLKRTYNAERCYDEYLKAVGTVRVRMYCGHDYLCGLRCMVTTACVCVLKCSECPTNPFSFSLSITHPLTLPTQPYLKWKSVSWHYADVTTAGAIANGSYRNKKSLEAQSRRWGSVRKEENLKSNEVKKKKIVTHVAEHYYEYDDCIDISDPFSYAGEAFVHMRTTSAHMFYDDYSRDNFIAQRKAFYAENKKDLFQDKIETTAYSHLPPHRQASSDTDTDAGSGTNGKGTRTRIKGKKSRAMRSKILHSMMLYGQTDSTQYILRFTYYLYSVLLLCSFWYRWMISSISTEAKLNMRKCLRKVDPGASGDGAVTITVTVSGAGKGNSAIAAAAASVGASASCAANATTATSSTGNVSSTGGAESNSSPLALVPVATTASSSVLDVFTYATCRAPQSLYINGRQVTSQPSCDLLVVEDSDSDGDGDGDGDEADVRQSATVSVRT